MADQDGRRSKMIPTSCDVSAHFTDVKGKFLRRAIYPLILIVIALMILKF